MRVMRAPGRVPGGADRGPQGRCSVVGRKVITRVRTPSKCFGAAFLQPVLRVGGRRASGLGRPGGCAARCGVPGTQVPSKIPFSPYTCREGGLRASDPANPAPG